MKSIDLQTLDNLHNTNVFSEAITINRFNPSRNVTDTIDRLSTDEDDNDESVIRTRL